MKNLAVYILVCLVSIAYSYETIVYISKVLHYDSVVCCDDFDCGEKEQDSKKGSSKDDKKEFKEYLNFKGVSAFFSSFNTSLWQNYRNLYPANDFSRCVYSPPETRYI